MSAHDPLGKPTTKHGKYKAKDSRSLEAEISSINYHLQNVIEFRYIPCKVTICFIALKYVHNNMIIEKHKPCYSADEKKKGFEFLHNSFLSSSCQSTGFEVS